MRVFIASISTLLLVLLPCQRAMSAEIKCDNVDDSATTHYSSSSTASKTESGKNCTVSIDGADAGSAVEFVAYCASWLGTDPDLLNQYPEMGPLFRLKEEKIVAIAHEIVSTLLVPTIPRIGLNEGAPELDRNLQSCLQWMSSLPDQHEYGSYPPRASFRSPVSDFLGDSRLLEGIKDCLRVGKTSSFDVSCSVGEEGRSVSIRFQTKYGYHVVNLPGFPLRN